MENNIENIMQQAFNKALELEQRDKIEEALLDEYIDEDYPLYDFDTTDEYRESNFE